MKNTDLDKEHETIWLIHLVASKGKIKMVKTEGKLCGFPSVFTDNKNQHNE